MKAKTFAGQERFCDLIVRESQAEDSDEAGCALIGWCVFQAFEEEFVILFIVGVFAGKAGAVDTGSAVKGVDGKARIIGKSTAIGGEGRFDGFFDRVAEKGGLVLDDRREGAGEGIAIVDGPGRVEERAQKTGEFASFAGVSRGDNKGAVPAWWG